MTALEEYTAHHAERVEDIMYRWSWRRFEGMFRRHLLRKAREELRSMHDMRVAALDANMNYDSKENAEAKTQRIESLRDALKESVRILYSEREPEAAQESFDDDPLFAPLRKRAALLSHEANQPLVEQAGAGRQLIGAT